MAKKEKKIKKNTLGFRFFKGIVKLFYKKRVIEGLENLPEEGCVIVANHSQIHSPLAFELYVDIPRAIWCDGLMMESKEVPNYAENNFWPEATDKQKKRRRVGMKLLAPLVGYLFSHAHTLPVYRDFRLAKTFRMSEESLEKGENLVIFPENEITNPDNRILDFFNEHFIDIAKIYYKKRGKILSFVPTYHCVELRKIIMGKPIPFNPENPIGEERKRLCSELIEAITTIATELPRHEVIPFIPLKKGEKRYSKD